MYIFKPEWKGAWRFSESQNLVSLASAGSGRAMPLSKGRSFDPVDIEIGPDRFSEWTFNAGSTFKAPTAASRAK